MVVDFSVGNFRSLKDIQSLNLAATAKKPKYPWLEQNAVAINPRHSCLKSKAIYGANASGKSNLIKAMAVFLNICQNSVRDETVLERIEPFRLDAAYVQQPTFFQMSFFLEGVRYRYGFEADQQKVHSEWLFATPSKKEVAYFLRDEEGLKINSRQFKEGDRLSFLQSEENSIVRSNSLFLGASASLNGQTSRKLAAKLQSIIVLNSIDSQLLKRHAYADLSNQSQRYRVLRFLQEAGIQLTDLRLGTRVSAKLKKEQQGIVATAKQDAVLMAIHQVISEDGKTAKMIAWDFEENESQGTQKLLQLSSFIIASLDRGLTLVIDEFESRLHTRLSKAIVELFHRENDNPNYGQFIFSTHDTNLLSAKLMRRDQIVFVRKDGAGASEIYSLSEIKGVRNDASYEKDYLAGKYDAVPVVGMLEEALIEYKTRDDAEAE